MTSGASNTHSQTNAKHQRRTSRTLTLPQFGPQTPPRSYCRPAWTITGHNFGEVPTSSSKQPSTLHNRCFNPLPLSHASSTVRSWRPRTQRLTLFDTNSPYQFYIIGIALSGTFCTNDDFPVTFSMVTCIHFVSEYFSWTEIITKLGTL